MSKPWTSKVPAAHLHDTLSPKAHRDSLRLFDDIVEAAERHGRESDPDMETGDLRGALAEAWKLLTPKQRERVYCACKSEDVIGEVWFASGGGE